MHATIPVATCVKRQQMKIGPRKGAMFLECQKCEQGRRVMKGKNLPEPTPAPAADKGGALARKWCSACKTTHPIDEFNKQTSGQHGRAVVCRAVAAARQRAWRARDKANRQELAAQARDTRAPAVQQPKPTVRPKAVSDGARTEKYCSACRTHHPIADFGMDNSRPDKLTLVCRKAKSARNRAWLDRKRARIRQEAVDAAPHTPEDAPPARDPVPETAGTVATEAEVRREPIAPSERFTTVVIDFTAHPELLSWLRGVAEEEERTVEAQIRYWMRRKHAAVREVSHDAGN
jgi:hypothetical protein